MGILTRNENGWCSIQLRRAMEKNGITPFCFSFSKLVAHVGVWPKVTVDEIDVTKELDALIMRPIGRGSLEEIIFRMDLLHKLHRLGIVIINPPSAIERSVDKFYTLALLEEAGLPVPRTVVTEDADRALEAFHKLGGDVVVKPIFGSRGIGSTRVSDPEVATRVFRALGFYHHVLYVQEFVQHGFSDIRAFVVGKRVVAAMRRVANTWKTNVSLGAKPVPLGLDDDFADLAVKAAEVIGCKVAGVDILESKKGPIIVELNSQPGWRGLQSVTKVNVAEEVVQHVLSEVKN
ncbi:MAG: RimK family alpha-L-glutamate ligase [Candidatus Bathyarchaeia archaeon]|nr:RimK family alpha-L-glutamate ligase [Candidatus Bathyarchaeota archaeon A05DMB-4]MDH7594744.1 RimK family alpha-L-glutamate ligase [Candidatus Bathyarchaeota archaeon]